MTTKDVGTTTKELIMGDLFHEAVPDEYIDRVFAVMALTPQHTYQVLTKRPERMRAYVKRHDVGLRWLLAADALGGATPTADAVEWSLHGLPNVWLGVSVEDQQRADERIPLLLGTPAAVRFLSCEPLIGPVDLTSFQPFRMHADWIELDGTDMLSFKRVRGILGGHISWVIVGGESGSHARPCDIDWIRSIVQQCRAADTPVFVKQLGSKPICLDTELWERDGRSWETQTPRGSLVPMKLRHRHGGDPAEWPADLRVREMPEVLL